MSKRKHAEAIQTEQNEPKKLKKPRTHEKSANEDAPAISAKNDLRQPPLEPIILVAPKNSNKAKKARRLAERLARQQRRDEERTDTRQHKKTATEADGPVLARRHKDDRAATVRKESSGTGGAISAPARLPEASALRTAKARQSKKHPKSKRTDEDAQRDDHQPSWLLSKPVGGQMLDLDPVFSPNEEYLIIAFAHYINVYSTATSLLVRTLTTDHSEPITTFTLSSTNPNMLYKATGDGWIYLWDWREGRHLSKWNVHSRIQHRLQSLALAQLADSEATRELMYTIDGQTGTPWEIKAHRLDTGPETQSSEIVTLRKSQEPITGFKVLQHGRVIIATSGMVEEETISKTKRSGKISQNYRMDTVIGGLQGSLHIYDDLLNKLVRMESNTEKPATNDLTSRQKHWHRNAVLSVKWSHDGNYIISGGLETVLLLWQLETGSHHTLPHLGAPLEGVVISPTGSSYAVRLADNSTMILSTTEFKATFSVAGLQLPAAEHCRPQLPYVASVDIPRENMLEARKMRSPIIAGRSNYLLCAVPSVTSSRVPSTLPSNASYLQTIDIASTQQVSRQALTRTKATDLNIGPEANTIEEPNVVLMQVSRSGDWLATVDEWMPPKGDLTTVAYDDKQALEAQESRREVYLKFWSWNDDSKVYELVSRIDNPHVSQSGIFGRHNRVLDLAVAPGTSVFATIGEDNLIRVWAARLRIRDGSIVRGQQGSHLLDWRCNATISIDPGTVPEQRCTTARMAYSSDGSCLAVACTWPSSPWTIKIIDQELGTSRSGPYGPLSGPLYGLGIIDQYLIALSDQLRVWNLVTQQLAYGFTLATQLQLSKGLPTLHHLAVNTEQKTFAVALPYVEEPKSARSLSPSRLRSKTIVFGPTNPAPIFETNALFPVTALAAADTRHCYITIDWAAQIQTITAGQRKPQTGIALPTPPPTPVGGLQQIYGDPVPTGNLVDEKTERRVSQFAANIPALSAEPNIEDKDEVPVVSSEKLTEALDAGPSHAMPPVTELFQRVARLFAGRRES
ncbi:MAG: hypothetical protein Q9218_002502 [Villophora microphyllina]